MKKVVLAYSGGLDTSVCIPMMKEDYGFDHIVTVTADVGQPPDDIKQAEERAAALGTEHYTIDARAEFVTDYCFPSVKANGDYQGYPLSTSIARPLIAVKSAQIARKVGADAFCHGCTGKGNDQLRFEFVWRTMCPDLPIIAPMREHNYTRTEEIEYAREHGVPIAQTVEKIWSIDENLWGRSIEGGHLEEPNYTPPEEIFTWTKSLADSRAEPEVVEFTFDKGSPVAVNGKAMDPVGLVKAAHEIAGRNGVGRVDVMEDRMLGLKVRENYECPAAVILIMAHKALESLVCTKDERQFKTMVDQKWGELAYAGLWFDPLKEDLEAFINRIQDRVTGTVRLQLFKGGAKVEGRSSKFALYSEDLASFDTKTFDQSEMTGAVKIHGLQSRMYWSLMKKD
ncbi:MAG: argininosuccinate synthase [Armatimonadetes bacterium]|nr:argininosuccinate synthase [Armatimonadota bacterium]